MASERDVPGGSDETVRMLVLQAHQISGQLDPRISLKSLVQSHGDVEEHADAETQELRFGKIGSVELGRLINERLAPGGLN